MVNGQAREVKADIVTIDLNGWTLGGSGAENSTKPFGIHAVGRKNIVVRNGTIRGFLVAVNLIGTSPFTNSKDHLVEDVLADSSLAKGIQDIGQNIIIRRNHVLDTGMGINFGSEGISVKGPGLMTHFSTISPCDIASSLDLDTSTMHCFFQTNVVSPGGVRSASSIGMILDPLIKIAARSNNKISISVIP